MFFSFVVMVAVFAVSLRAVAGTAPAAASVTTPAIVNPVAQVRQQRSWEYGPFIDYGNGFGNRSSYKFLWGGVQLGKVMTPVVHAGFFSGQFELGGNIMPLWQAYTPAPYTGEATCSVNGVVTPCVVQYEGGTFRGVSLTPLILRWNFLTHSRRLQPWFQAAGGLIYTTHKFPPNYGSAIIDGQVVKVDGGTSVWNFAPQGGGGFHYFIRPGRSIDVGVNAVHISSASLGDRNPGVNASIQIQLGYTFWK
ncbi:MAG: acyloxyacyl hydrolase [Terracidiphilus sp.]